MSPSSILFFAYVYVLFIFVHSDPLLSVLSNFLRLFVFIFCFVCVSKRSYSLTIAIVAFFFLFLSSVYCLACIFCSLFYCSPSSVFSCLLLTVHRTADRRTVLLIIGSHSIPSSCSSSRRWPRDWRTSVPAPPAWRPVPDWSPHCCHRRHCSDPPTSLIYRQQSPACRHGNLYHFVLLLDSARAVSESGLSASSSVGILVHMELQIFMQKKKKILTFVLVTLSPITVPPLQLSSACALPLPIVRSSVGVMGLPPGRGGGEVTKCQQRKKKKKKNGKEETRNISIRVYYFPPTRFSHKTSYSFIRKFILHLIDSSL